MENQNINQEVKKIINIYNQIYKNMVKPWLYIIAFIVSTSLIVFWADFDKNFSYIENYDDEKIGKIDTEKWYKARNIYYNEEFVYSWFNIKFLWWELYSTWDNIKSNRSILSIDWFTVPSNLKIDNNLENVYNRISTWEYWSREIETIIRENILNENDFKNDDNNYSKKDLENDDIIEHFWLWCNDWVKLGSYICKQNIDNFIDNFYRYNIWNDINWFNKITSQLDDNNKERVCNWIIKHQEKFKINDEYIINISRWCDSQIRQKVNNYVQFINYLEETEWRLSSRSYQNRKINLNKLFEFQKQIYQNRDNVSLISSYLSFIEQLFDRNHIDQKYADIIYYYNNRFLSNFIAQIRSSNQRHEREQTIERISNTLSEINSWNRIQWYEWIENIASESILAIFNKDEAHWSSQRVETFNSIYENHLSRIRNYSESSNQINNSERTVETEWIFRIIDWEQVNRYDVKMKLNNQWSSFYIKKIEIEWYENVQDTLDNLINENNVSINNMISYLRTSWILNEEIEEDDIEFCEKITENIEYDTECKEWWFELYKNWEEYYFWIKWEILDSFKADDNNIQYSVNNILYENTIYWDNIVYFVESLFTEDEIDDEIDDEINISIWDINYINTRTSRFFWTQIEVVWTEWDWVYIVEWEIDFSNVRFTIDLNNNNRVYDFKILEWSNEYLIENFSIDIITMNRNTLNQMQTNLFWVLEEYDPQTISQLE